MRKYKERAVKYFAVFLLFMLVCTIVSRGIYAWQMPKISTGSAEPRALMRRITANGYVLTKEEVPVTLEAGILIEKTLVVEGQKVSPGDLLLQADLSDLEKTAGQLDSQIRSEEAKLAELNVSGNNAVSRANQDLKDVSDSFADAVSRADQALQAARAERNAFPSKEQYKENAYKKDAEYQKLKKAAGKKKASKEEKESFQFYKKSLDQTLDESYEQEKQALDHAAEEMEQALNEANANRDNALKQARRDLEDAKNGGENGAKIEQQNAIFLLKEKRAALAALQQAEGKVLCEIEGHVSRILSRAGERTTDTAALVLSDGGGEKLFQAILPQEEKSYIAAGDKMTLSFQGGKSLNGVEIEAVGELEDKSCQVTGKVSDSGVNVGDLGIMEMNIEIGRYACAVPIDALHNDGGTDYVLIVEEHETILGTELVARKRKVKALERDEEYVALEDGSLTDEEKFVADFDKEIADGTRVRLKEE